MRDGVSRDGAELQCWKKVTFAVTLGFILVIGSVVGWGAAKFLIDLEDQGPSVTLPETGKLKKKTNQTTGSKQNAPAPTCSYTLPVDSYGPDAIYDIAQWSQGEQYSGYIDAVLVNGVPLPKDGSHQCAPWDVIEMKGWPGEVWVGIKLPYVIVPACGKIVGNARVTGPRPDLAKAVHRNLTVSGWRLRIATNFLPNCANWALRVWGVALGWTRLVLPLNSYLPILAPVRAAVPESNVGKTVTFENPDLLTVMNMLPLRSLTLMVTAKKLNMRSCGDV